MKINYVVGDALQPIGEGNRIVCHCVNCQGIMGGGIAVAVRKKWPHVYKEYCKFCKQYEEHTSELLGLTQLIKAQDGIAVANIFGQNDLGNENIGDVFIPPVDYRALEVGFARLKVLCFDIENKVGKLPTIHTCRLGTGLAGGSWDRIEEILERVFGNTNWEITVYDLK